MAEITTDLVNMANALAVAKQAELMSREHAGAIWKKLLKESGFDVAKPLTPAPAEGKAQAAAQ
jgi:hypothetical protein